MWRQRVPTAVLVLTAVAVAVVVSIGGNTAPAVGAGAPSVAGGDAVPTDRSPPSAGNVTAEVRKNVTDLAAGESATLQFSAAEEDAVGVRQLSVTAAEPIDDTWIAVAAVRARSVETPRGTVIRLFYLEADAPDAFSRVALEVPIRKPGIGSATVDTYHRDGEWLTADSTPVAVARSGDRVVLRVTVTGPGYIAVLTPTTTPTATTATAWPPATTLPPPDRVAGGGLRAAIGLVALLGAGLLAVRGGRG